MHAPSESLYRQCRRAFIAACEAAHVDAIARLHPTKADKPLFMDAAALGPRLAGRALMLIACDPAGSAIAVALLGEKFTLGPDTRLVFVHALDPPAFAGAPADPAWASAMLMAVAREDMSRVSNPLVLALGDEKAGAQAAQAVRGFQTPVTLLSPAASLAHAKAAIAAFLGG